MSKEIFQTDVYKICQGVYLEKYYTDTNKVYGEDPVKEKWTLRIDYCVRGRFEAEFTENRHSYIESGQFAINTTDYDIVSYYFPGSIYQGLSLIFYEEIMDREYLDVLKFFHLSLGRLNKSVDCNKAWLVDRAYGSLKEVFEELFFSFNEEKEDYFRLKTLEVLFILNRMSLEDKKDFIYSSDNTILRIKEAVSQALSKDSDFVDLKKLIRKTKINPSHFYRLFKQIYGETPAKYFREYRLNLAASQLLNTNKLIQEIAMDAGYENSGKFSAAFRRVYRTSPHSYRKNINMECLE